MNINEYPTDNDAFLGQTVWFQSTPIAYEEYPYVLPWWLRTHASEYHWLRPLHPYSRQHESAVSHRGYFTDAFPHWYPYYPVPTTNPAWMDPWSMQTYQGYWWNG